MSSDPVPSRRFSVTGMNCAACSARVEKAVRAVPGMEECAVSLLTNEMSVAGSASDAAVVAAVEKAGYGAAPVEDRSTPTDIQHSAFSILPSARPLRNRTASARGSPPRSRFSPC